MNYQGCQRKFDVKSFVAKYPPAKASAAAANSKGDSSSGTSKGGKQAKLNFPSSKQTGK